MLETSEESEHLFLVSKSSAIKQKKFYLSPESTRRLKQFSSFVVNCETKNLLDSNQHIDKIENLLYIYRYILSLLIYLSVTFNQLK